MLFLTQAGADRVSSSVDVLNMVLNAGLMVKLVMLVLLLFSVVCWAIIIFKLAQLSKARRQSFFFLDLFWKSRNLSSIYNDSAGYEASPLAQIFRVGYQEMNQLRKSAAGSGLDTQTLRRQGLENVQRALRRAAGAEATRLSRSLTFLATTGNTTPFIGLFGTVWGIMGSFHNIGLTGSANLAAVAPGISEALVATAAGLAAAIPAVVAYNHFASRVRVLDAEMTNFVADFLNNLERDLMRKAAQ
ncbi:MAG: protein TolQ [Proteobacteria bacterium]|nr:protein TolQ [Pseudomonadota bacterium]